ncbi:MAG: hypothetical protein AB8B65_09885, partial [Kordia sp.]|uniref:hypothetical protein n=1 Tax=Kordia sp. TaxID=1965332 RepID=UPI00385F5610
MRKLIIILILFLSFSCESLPKDESNMLVFPENRVLSETFEQKKKKQKQMFHRIFIKDSLRIKQYSVEFILDKIDNNKEYQ